MNESLALSIHLIKIFLNLAGATRFRLKSQPEIKCFSLILHNFKTTITRSSETIKEYGFG